VLMLASMRKLALRAAWAAVCLVLSGCALPFYWQAIGGQLQLMTNRTPIDRILEDPKQDPVLKERLRRVAEIRRFAVEELGLPDNESYTTYVDIGRPYVVWNVIATQEFAVDPERWCYPFTGCVAYRGFFKRERAERFRARLERRGLDTHIAGAGAYSTLGFFADPVLSTMIVGSDEYIAATLFHELAHQKLYIRDDSTLSEAFASAVEEYGTQRWLERNEEQEALERYRQRLVYRDGFSALVAAQQQRLRAVFARSDPPEAMRAAKEDAYRAMREDYEALKARWAGVRDYDAWFAQPLNNAMLASVATYRHWLPGLRWRLGEVGLEAFYADMERLAELGHDERAAWLEAWLARRSAPGRLSET
jgi:predicted aminopeptidase